MRQNDGERFERLPAADADRDVEGRATRAAVVEYFDDRFGVDPSTFEGVTFWEKGAGKVWALSGTVPSPSRVETLGLPVLRTRQEHWKPTTVFASRFGRRASRNVVRLADDAADRFLAGEVQTVDWDGDWGYLLVCHELADRDEPIGVGRYLHGELESMLPKSRRLTR